MGLTDFITRALKGGKKSPSLTSKSLTSKSMVSSSVTKKPSRYVQTRPLVGVPNSWNKDGVHIVSIKVINSSDPRNSKVYRGYVLASNAWVEIHCFDSSNELRDFVAADRKNHGKSYIRIATILKGIRLSAITTRQDVYFDSTKNEIQVCFKDEDFTRWRKWHPKNDYRCNFPELVKICYKGTAGYDRLAQEIEDYEYDTRDW